MIIIVHNTLSENNIETINGTQMRERPNSQFGKLTKSSQYH